MSTLRLRGPDQVIGLRKWPFGNDRKILYVRDDVEGVAHLREDGMSIVMRGGALYRETEVFIRRDGRNTWPYEIHIAGADPKGFALRVGFAKTVDEAVEKARSYVIPKEKQTV